MDGSYKLGKLSDRTDLAMTLPRFIQNKKIIEKTQNGTSSRTASISKKKRNEVSNMTSQTQSRQAEGNLKPFTPMHPGTANDLSHLFTQNRESLTIQTTPKQSLKTS